MGSGSWETIPFSSGGSNWAPVLFHQGIEGCRVSGHRAVCMADLQNDAHATIYGSSIQQHYTLGAVHRLSGWRAVFEHLQRLPCGAGASTPVRGERSRPWPATEVTKAGDQTASPREPEGGLVTPPASTKKARIERPPQQQQQQEQTRAALLRPQRKPVVRPSTGLPLMLGEPCPSTIFISTETLSVFCPLWWRPRGVPLALSMLIPGLCVLYLCL